MIVASLLSIVTFLLCGVLQPSRTGWDDPTEAKEFMERGHTWRAKGEWEKAIRDYSEAIRLAPKDPEGHYYRGWARAEAGQLKTAVEDFSEAIRLDPKHALAFYNRANAWLRV